jgi:hypothetical protein
MKQYRIKPYIAISGNIRYAIEERLFFIFWTHCGSFSKEENAIEYRDKLNKKYN